MAKILLVDDDPLLIRMYQKKFEVDGYQVSTLSDGERVQTEALFFKPDLILLDIMMPKVNGLEALKKIKSDEKTRNIPVILLTNLGGNQDDVDQGLELGAVSYLVKSNYTPKSVVEKVKEILQATVKEIPKVKTKIVV
ncbi:MAG: response regulator [Patescibacteria group bacterium]|jgi:DNA-binding response OmpR family regulator